MSPEVFVSYSWDSSDHKDRVRELADNLNNQGVDCEIDQYVKGTPDKGWPTWCKLMISESKYVVVIWTQTYLDRYEGKAAPGVGRGAKWEGAIIAQHIYEEDGAKFIPVIFSPGDKEFIAKEHARHTIYDLSTKDGYEELYRHITDQPKFSKPALGVRTVLPVTGTTSGKASLSGATSKVAGAEQEIALQAFNGRNRILRVDIDSGTHINVNGYSYDDSEEQRQLFLQALESMEKKKLARYEGGILFELTDTGLRWAREIQEKEEESDRGKAAKTMLKQAIPSQSIDTVQTCDGHLCVFIEGREFGRNPDEQELYLEGLRSLIRGGFVEPDFQPEPMKYVLTFRGRQEARRLHGWIP